MGNGVRLEDALPFGAIIALTTLVNCRPTDAFTLGELDARRRYTNKAAKESSIVDTWTEMSERDRPTAYELGIHSNIPECCVRFYCARSTKEIVRLNDARDAVDGPHVGYVMCASCWRKVRRGELTPNVVHICLDSRDGPLCHAYLSGPDRAAGVPIKERYTHYSLLERIA
jgi:hypothetical protein